MDASFWHKRWEDNEIGFHENDLNKFLLTFFENLSLASGDRVFLPLCGKTKAIQWLLSNGYRVVGAELSKIAVDQLFSDIGIEPTISAAGQLDHYSAKDIDIFAGDIFDISQNTLGTVHAIYDRAALVAMPRAMRPRYTAHLMEITNTAPQLLICYEYDQSLMDGPPFSVNNDEIIRHYGENYVSTLILSADVPGGLKRQFPAKESVWLLKST